MEKEAKGAKEENGCGLIFKLFERGDHAERGRKTKKKTK